MFKTDKESLEDLSFKFNERDLANLKAILEYLQKRGLSTLSPEEVQRTLSGIDAIGRLKLEGKIYAFHVYDSYAQRQSESCEGVELYLRQGNTLNEFYVPNSRDFVYSTSDAIDFLHSKKIRTIYTGSIPKGSDFLGVSQECDDEDPMTRRALGGGEVYLFNSHDINVVTLDSLI
jgi:hypothetical protein